MHFLPSPDSARSNCYDASRRRPVERDCLSTAQPLWHVRCPQAGVGCRLRGPVCSSTKAPASKNSSEATPWFGINFLAPILLFVTKQLVVVDAKLDSRQVCHPRNDANRKVELVSEPSSVGDRLWGLKSCWSVYWQLMGLGVLSANLAFVGRRTSSHS